MSNVIRLKSSYNASSVFVPSYEPHFSTSPNEFSQSYDFFVYNQASSNLCGLLSIYGLILLQNPYNTLLPKDDVNVLALCSKIYKYNKSQGKRDTIYNLFESFKEYTGINMDNLSQCKDINSIKDAMVHNRGVILNIPLSHAIEKYDKEFKVNITDSTIYTNDNHAVLAYEYKSFDEQLYLNIINSHGISYGNKGRVWLPIDYMMGEYPYTFTSSIKNE